jgi:hypothetical protein
MAISARVKGVIRISSDQLPQHHHDDDSGVGPQQRRSHAEHGSQQGETPKIDQDSQHKSVGPATSQVCGLPSILTIQ